jgi:hypothetical protein
MLVIRTEQMAVFDAQARERFITQTLGSMPEVFPDDHISIDGEWKVLALPTSGSTDILGANPNISSEINKTGIGGGSVLMDRVFVARSLHPYGSDFALHSDRRACSARLGPAMASRRGGGF